MPPPNEEANLSDLPARVGTLIGNIIVEVMVASLLWAIIAKFV
jgi:hypothetical protein